MTHPIVVNKRTHTATPRDKYIGRGSPYGNPFRIGPDGTREEVIEKYRQRLWQSLKTSPTARQELLALGNYRYLVCYCAPLPCHGEVLVRALLWLQEHPHPEGS